MKRLVDQAMVIVPVIIPALNFQRLHKAAHLSIPLCSDSFQAEKYSSELTWPEIHLRTLGRYDDFR
jgi:hypothetical protein